jgi:hypothetical protein
MADTKEVRDIKRQRREAAASLDLSYAFEDIAKKHKLRGWEAVAVLQEMAFKYVDAAIKTIDMRDEKRARARRKSARA